MELEEVKKEFLYTNEFQTLKKSEQRDKVLENY